MEGPVSTEMTADGPSISINGRFGLTSSGNKKKGIAEKSEALFQLAIGRDDIKQMVRILPADSEIDPVAVEYELQLLKILTVGWSISFFLENHPDKTVLAESFWESIRSFAQSISTMSSSSTGREIDYFSTLKERVGIYVNALQVYSDVDDPSAVIGPTFAKVCGDEENPLVITSGRSMFSRTLQETRKHLESAGML